ncbi:hypothetical protein IP88_07235 [alpha proteobacterium AAP81b]|nr:hypothetical protein IP88_07235 [alpha proteobacterium AAP81b]
MSLLAGLAAATTVAGIGYQVTAAWATARWLKRPHTAALPAPAPPIVVLKPLHGAEPRLEDDLAAVLTQDWPAPVRLVCGVQRADDPAIAIVESVAARFPGRVELVVDATRHGGNAKISNLVNMIAAAGPPADRLLVLADSDIGVPSGWLARIAGELARPGVGAVTCLYHARPGPEASARLSAMGVSWSFLPSVCVGLTLGLAKPCMGSTIALHEATLARIGGIGAFADVLADDHAIGMAVRDLGLAVAVPGFTVGHDAHEASVAALAAHELRWNLTLRRLDPGGFIGFALVNPLPFALLALAAAPGAASAALALAALAARATVAVTVNRLTGTRPGGLWWLPLRDLLSLALIAASYTRRNAAWRGSHLAVGRDGRIAA